MDKFTQWHKDNDLIWFANMQWEMAYHYDKKKTKEMYGTILYVISWWCTNVNRFMDDNLVKGNIIKEEAIRLFMDYVLDILEPSVMQAPEDSNPRFIMLQKTFKRCKGIFK